METNSLKFESLISTWTLRNPNVALVTAEGLNLVSRTHHCADLCTLPVTVQLTQKYLKLRSGELAICNDPYAGGSIPSQVTLVTAMDFQPNTNDELSVLIGIRISTRPKLNGGKTTEEEGLRIPPTPLGNLDQPTEAIISAIAAHPMAPDDFVDRIHKGLAGLRAAKTSLLTTLRSFNLQLTRQLCQSHVQYSHDRMKALLGEFPHGHSEVQWQFGGGEKLRLKLENTGSRLTLDFTGTGKLSGFHLSDGQVLGCAIRTLEVMSGHNIMVNSGSLLAVNIITPQDSMLSSQSPCPTNFGVLVGTHTICDLITRAMSYLHPKKKAHYSNTTPTAISLKFANQSFFDLLYSGSQATVDRKGEAFIDCWNENALSASVEDIEAKFPLEILAIKKRTDSGGAGDQRGGEGVLKTYRLNEPAVLRWFSGFGIKPENHSGLGLAGEIIVKIDEKETSYEGLSGELTLPARAEITVMSRGGHGVSR